MTTDEIIAELQAMETDEKLVTNDAYSPNLGLYPDGRIPFVDIHMSYLKSHKNVDPKNYLSNLRIMTTRR